MERTSWSYCSVEPVLMSGSVPRSHVARTGEIKDFVVTEESGIAKGIRRVVAVTGHEAAEARRLGDSLTAQLNRIETMPDAEKDAALKAYTVVSEATYIRHEIIFKAGRRLSSKSVRPTFRCSRRTNFAIVSLPFAKRSTSTLRTKRPRRIRR